VTWDDVATRVANNDETRWEAASCGGAASCEGAANRKRRAVVLPQFVCVCGKMQQERSAATTGGWKMQQERSAATTEDWKMQQERSAATTEGWKMLQRVDVGRYWLTC